MRVLFAVVLAITCGWFATADVCAQSCHAPMLVAPRELGLRVALETTAATFDNSHAKGNFQGIAAALTWTKDPVQLYARAPWWRVERDGDAASGVGDLSLAARLRVWKSGSDFLRTGVAFAGSLPTGDSDRDLGMGHVMLTPGAYLALHDDVYTAELLVSYGVALSHGETHTEGSGLTPIVTPMNSSELQIALAGVRRMHELFSLVVGGFLAFPVGMQMHDHTSADHEMGGRTRAFTNAGLRFHRDWLDATLEGALPLAGDPFDVRGTLSLGASF